MPTNKDRINITLSKEVKDALEKISRRDNMPQATKAARLVEMAIELEEDQLWNEIAEKRDNSKAKYISHDDAWK